MIFCFDLDGTLCDENKNLDYTKSKPFLEMIRLVNTLYENGHTIKIFTGRGASTGIDWKDFTVKQLKNWEIKYHEFITGKPHHDIYIDNKCLNAQELRVLIHALCGKDKDE